MKGSNIKRISSVILLDILVTAPLAYWLAIRKTCIKNSTVIRVVVVGIVVARFVLRHTNNNYSPIIKH